ncbi:hypothetical protein [Seonamhaeicola sp. ML3]|uniref:hypothetical protein n=1 Tax=Seonamhaeicola sp. ML3 TaxID=2937786 RepID=UPI00200FA01B|nr:hypothetical protein [Seonamhaeicola sp. ML3]
MKNLIYLLGFILIFSACSSNSTDDVSSPDPDPIPNPNPNPNPTAKVTYDADIKSIISNNCLNCHGNPRQNGAPTSYTTFSQVRNGVDGIINRINRTGGGVMPPSGQMSSSTRALIQQWKDDGLLEN